MPDSTGQKQADTQFKPGQSGNPNGRPKGSRNKLGEAFLSALLDDFEEHGIASIKAMREESPRDYVKVVASTLPSELNVKVSELDELTDDQLQRQLAAGLAALAAMGFDPLKGAGPQEPARAAKDVPTIQ